MNNFTKTALTFLAVTMLSMSCKKDDDSSTVSQPDQLIGTWTSVSLTSDKPYQWTSTVKGTDGFTFRSDCAKGTYLTFTKGTANTGGSYIFFDNCEKGSAQGVWTAGNNVLNLNGEDRQIVQLDGSTLKYSYTTFVNNEPINITTGFTKK